MIGHQGELRLPDSLLPARPLGRPTRPPVLPERFLPPPGFVWGSFIAADGAVLRWGHLPVRNARAECVMVGGFGEFIEKQFETVRDLAARGIAVWCLDWRGQGGSIRPRRLPTRPRARNFERDAEDLAAFAAAKLRGHLPRLLVAHSIGGAIPCLRPSAVGSAPMPSGAGCGMRGFRRSRGCASTRRPMAGSTVHSASSRGFPSPNFSASSAPRS